MISVQGQYVFKLGTLWLIRIVPKTLSLQGVRNRREAVHGTTTHPLYRFDLNDSDDPNTVTVTVLQMSSVLARFS